ncbi:hypothetical protein SD77_2991 [Bacillus badius]|uniref:Uncharacterized protein n=1 Tax=Bacillus badius TaxID=1455 RepID=A0ABR5AP12_BACBA|nr:hypothetical protein SD77_2991 [Bacillus badius]
MKLFKVIKEFEITLSGGFALYALYCMLFVTLLGIIQTLKWLLR